MWDPAGSIERWGNETVAWVGGTEYFIVMVLSFAMAYCFGRDFHDGSTMTRGYFLTMMWKRICMGLIAGSHVVMFASPRAGIILLLVAGFAYTVVSTYFIIKWVTRHKSIKKDEFMGHLLRQEGLDLDTMKTDDAMACARKMVGAVLDKVGAENSNIHHHA